MKLKFFTTLAFLLMVPLTVLGQNGTITGHVTDSNGDALPGANVIIEDLSLGSSTNNNGDYTIDSVPVGTHNVVTRFIGFLPVTQEATVAAGQTLTLDFVLSEDAVLLE